MATEDTRIDEVKNILTQMPEDERSDFVNKFNQLKTDEDRGLIADRLISNYNQATQQEEPQQQDPTLQETFGDNTLVNSILAPLVEMSRGLYSASASTYGKLDAVKQLAEKIPGIEVPAETMFPFLETDKLESGLFQDISKNLEAVAEDLPETGMHVAPKTIYSMIGGAVPVLTEFAGAGKVLQGATNFLKDIGYSEFSEPAKFALVQAIDEYERNPELKSLATGAGKGFATGLTFQMAQSGLKLLWNYGKNTAKSFIQWITNDKKLAKDFVNNPQKYNLGPGGKIRSAKEVAEENAIAKEQLKQKYDNRKTIFKDRQRREKSILEMKQKTELNKMQQNVMESKQEQALKTGKKLEDIAEQTKKDIELNNATLKDRIVNVYDNFLQKMKIVRDEAGEQVNNAVSAIMKRDPSASISSNIVMRRVNGVIKRFKNSPFIIEKGNIVRRTAGANQADAKTANAIYQEMKIRQAEGKLSLEYLQNLKRDLQARAGEAFGRQNKQLGKFYSEWAKKVNPANIVTDNPSLGTKLKELAEANKNYHSFVPKYEEAMNQYFKVDSQGNPIPNIDKAVNAVRKNDTVSMRQMIKADKVLPKDERILPQVRKIVKDMESFEMKQKAMIKFIKNKAKVERNELIKSSKISLDNLRKNQKQLKTDQNEVAINNLRNFMEKADNEYNAVIEQMNKVEGFLKQQDALRKFPASSETMAGLLQRILGFGTAASLPFSPGGSVLSGMGALGMSPRVASTTLKPVIMGSEYARQILGPLIKSKEFAQVVGTEISKKGR